MVKYKIIHGYSMKELEESISHIQDIVDINIQSMTYMAETNRCERCLRSDHQPETVYLAVIKYGER